MSARGLYFCAFFSCNSRSVKYNKRDTLRKLTDAMLEIPEQFRPVLFSCSEYKLFYIHQPNFVGAQNDLIAIRRILESNMRSVDRQANYHIGFDSPDTEETSLAYELSAAASESSSSVAINISCQA